MYCTNCGKELGPDKKCHNPLCNADVSSSNNINSNAEEFINLNKNNQTNENAQYQNYYAQKNTLDVSINEFATFVGPKNTEYYMDKFQKYEVNQSFASWNWAAFFLTIYWLLYRKMYKVAAIVFATNLAMTFILSIFAPIVSLAIMIGLGVYGNLLYTKDSIKKITNIKRFSSNLSESEYSNRLMFNGGTSLTAIFIFAGITIVIILIVVIILGTMLSALGGYYYY